MSDLSNDATMDSAEHVEQDEAVFAESLRRAHPVLWYATLLGPILSVPAVLLSVGLVAGWGVAHRLALTVLATCFFFGRFMILAGESGAGADVEYGSFFSPAQLALLVFFLDVMTAVVVVFHMNVLFHLPVLGKRLQLLVEKSRNLLQSQRWMKRLTVAGVVVFVMFPLASTGSLGGSILGRLLGLSRGGTLASVIAGSVLGCGTMYFGAGLISTWFDRDDPVVQIAGPAVIATLVILLSMRYRKLIDSDASVPA